MELTKEEIAELLPSLRRYFRDELDQEIGDLRAKLLLDYIWKEIGPVAYNRGVKDAENYFRHKVEDLAGSCFQPPLTYWLPKRKA